MVLVLRLDIIQHSLELTRAHRKSAKSALPVKAAIPAIKRFDPLRGRFLYLFDELSLGKCSRQRRDNVNVISHTANVRKLCAEIAADCRQISVHARAHV